MQPIGTSGMPMTSQIPTLISILIKGREREVKLHISFSLHSLSRNSRYQLRRIVIQDNVIMPRDFLRMHENVHIREIIVILNDIRQINHYLVPLICNFPSQLVHPEMIWKTRLP